MTTPGGLEAKVQAPANCVSALAALIDTLAEDSPSENIESALDSLIGETAASAHPDDVIRLRGATRHVGRLLQRGRRREAELSALYATALDLAEVRDVDVVLEAIARRAQQVVPAADATYLCLRDESTGGFYSKVSVGLVSERFMNVKVPPGHGMAGVIERTRAPLLTRQYGSDGNFTHDPELDSAVAADGLTSVLGTPFMSHGEVVGILFAANRIERSYSRDETALLAQFANHAALALNNAQVVADLEAAHLSVARDVTALERAARLHEALTALMIRGGDFADVADALYEVFPDRLVLLDIHGNIITTRGEVPGGRDGSDGNDDPTISSDVATSRRSRRCVVSSGEQGWRYVAPLGSEQAPLGAIVLHSERGLPRLDIRTFERAAQIVTLLALRQQALAQAEESVRGELLTELLGNRRVLSEATRLFARSRQFDLSSSQIAVAIRVPEDKRLAVRRVLPDIARNADGLGGDYGGVLAVVVPGDDAQQAAEQIRQRLRVTLDAPAVVCAAMPVDPLTGELAESFAAASRCLPLLLALGHDEIAMTTRDLALYSLLFDPDRADDLRAFVHSTLDPLLRYDREQGTDLVNTVNVYLASGSNASRAARDLYIHLNTMAKRLSRVASLLGDDWQSESRSLPLRMALRLHTLAQRSSELER